MSATRFCGQIFSDISTACIAGNSRTRLAALPALCAIATKWPNQPVVVRHNSPVAAVDETFLVVCAAANDLDEQV